MRYLIIILLLLLSVSCSKERTIHISAKNAVTDEPYAGLKYEVIREHGKTWEEKYIRVASGILNENGEIFITKRLPINDAYTIRVEEPANSCYSKNISLHFGGEANFEAPFEFAECAYLKRNITNINCEGSNDYMILNTKNEVNSLGETGWEFFGCNGYDGNHFSEVPFGSYYFMWEVTRNNITNTYYDTIYLNPGEYKTYDINY